MFQNISGNRATEQNIPPGTVIDTKIVSPVINEFYLNSHSAFQVSLAVNLLLEQLVVVICRGVHIAQIGLQMR